MSSVTNILPQDPSSLQEAGLAESTIESLILKILYFRGDLYGRDLSVAVGLKFSVIQDVVETLKLHHHLQVKRSLGVGNVGAILALTEAGRARAKEALEANRYAGPAPVPLEQYIALVKEQRPKQGWLTRKGLEDALSCMVTTEHLLSQVGPAVSSANSMLLYGKPGDGKTFLIESLNNLESSPVFVPHAIECQGNIIQVYDPVYHQRLDQPAEESVLLEAVGNDATYDHRWVKCRRPFIVSGGELTLDMLDLRFNDTSKIYEAPFQLKANNGIYLIDDFGRQRAAPTEVLNRWIVPMERRNDYLNFVTGGKMTVPFETFLVFSTNLNPAELGDEAFLRRIQYKMLMRGPSQGEFETIFRNFCTEKKLPFAPDVLARFIDKNYLKPGKAFRRCHPRDVLTHALNLIHFEKLPFELTDALMKRAFESCFLQEEEDVQVVHQMALAATA
jgi:predicted ATPase with chaperone activity